MLEKKEIHDISVEITKKLLITLQKYVNSKLLDTDFNDDVNILIRSVVYLYYQMMSGHPIKPLILGGASESEIKNLVIDLTAHLKNNLDEGLESFLMSLPNFYQNTIKEIKHDDAIKH